MRSCILVRWRLSRACTLRASVKSKRSCIAPWPTHGLRSESCACASASRKRPHQSSNLTSRTFGGYSRQRNEHETRELMRYTPRADSLHCFHSARDGVVREQPRDHLGIQIRPNFDDYFVVKRVCHAVTLARAFGGTVGSVLPCTGAVSEHGGRINDIRRTAGSGRSTQPESPCNLANERSFDRRR